jgi:hypothetical protein
VQTRKTGRTYSEAEIEFTAFIKIVRVVFRFSSVIKNFMALAEIIVYAAFIYLGLGSLFAVWFAARGVTKLDDAAQDTSFAFRFIIFFGAAAFWVLLARRLIKGEKRPAEKNAHRQSSELRL